MAVLMSVDEAALVDRARRYLLAAVRSMSSDGPRSQDRDALVAVAQSEVARLVARNSHLEEVRAWEALRPALDDALRSFTDGSVACSTSVVERLPWRSEAVSGTSRFFASAEPLVILEPQFVQRFAVAAVTQVSHVRSARAARGSVRCGCDPDDHESALRLASRWSSRRSGIDTRLDMIARFMLPMPAARQSALLEEAGSLALDQPADLSLVCDALWWAARRVRDSSRLQRKAPTRDADPAADGYWSPATTRVPSLVEVDVADPPTVDPIVDSSSANWVMELADRILTGRRLGEEVPPTVAFSDKGDALVKPSTPTRISVSRVLRNLYIDLVEQTARGSIGDCVRRASRAVHRAHEVQTASTERNRRDKCASRDAHRTLSIMYQAAVGGLVDLDGDAQSALWAQVQRLVPNWTSDRFLTEWHTREVGDRR